MSKWFYHVEDPSVIGKITGINIFHITFHLVTFCLTFNGKNYESNQKDSNY